MVGVCQGNPCYQHALMMIFITYACVVFLSYLSVDLFSSSPPKENRRIGFVYQVFFLIPFEVLLHIYTIKDSNQPKCAKKDCLNDFKKKGS